MKKLSLLLTTFLLLQITTPAQEGWFQQSIGTNFSFLSVFFIDNDTGWVVGVDNPIDKEIILKTTDGGWNWISQLSGDDNLLEAVQFINQDTGWVVGENGRILKTTDGGTNWFFQASGTTESLFSVYFTENNTGWAVGNNGVIVSRTDGGTNWTSQTSGTTELLWSVYFTENNTGWIVGGRGTILKTTTGGTTFIEEQEIDEIPTDYNLSQNYPNPFNPSTKIKYSIPQSSNVVIKVLDIIGNEIETLIDEQKSTGTYEITWYAESLPSGIYFYQLQAGNFVETKKIVLMK